MILDQLAKSFSHRFLVLCSSMHLFLVFFSGVRKVRQADFVKSMSVFAGWFIHFAYPIILLKYSSFFLHFISLDQFFKRAAKGTILSNPFPETSIQICLLTFYQDKIFVYWTICLENYATKTFTFGFSILSRT